MRPRRILLIADFQSLDYAIAQGLKHAMIVPDIHFEERGKAYDLPEVLIPSIREPVKASNGRPAANDTRIAAQRNKR